MARTFGATDRTTGGRVRNETDEEKLERGREEGRRNKDSAANQKEED